MKQKSRKQSNTVQQPLVMNDSPVKASLSDGTSWHQMEAVIGKSVAVELRVLKFKLTTDVITTTSEFSLLQYLAGISQLFFLIKVKLQEEIPDIRQRMIKFLGNSGLEAHRILFYTCDASKMAMMRQISPQFYFDDNEEVLAYLRKFIDNAICIGSAQTARKSSFEAFFNE
ncbi:hypothetical protein XU18_2557 [Perkinsela sp. CCAP 1560/4]|nr:hypothetical protein XU18_4139 [Perkinsela sp. CCAP 1560/4]KNH06656.1 hypothetical protein XU18_2557 [Perkinsela sp. CCAP 1560/4]|eukprot:KNH04651.1 hypothetical protein XU18_4139 [Perkinsela sp. CCAP 1560/4]